MKRNSAWLKYDEQGAVKVERFARAYRAFLDAGKTERECVAECVAQAQNAGYTDLNAIIRSGQPLKPGDRVYINHMNKVFMMFVIGSEPIVNGMNILGAHIDSPRIDVKPEPLYEDGGMAYLDTRYYGGIKKYQWVAMPLSLHGVIVRKDGTSLNVCIGEAEEDPVFCISDLLPHLAQEQMQREASKIIDGEDLDLIIAGRPLKDGEEKEAVLANVLKLLKDKYNLEEADFLSAELEIVPACKARDMGLDRSMILAYGHDDRVCAYPSMRALIDFEGIPARTLCCVLTDKEEIGSVGATGMNSQYFENAVAEVCALASDQPYSDLTLRRCLASSRMLSSDVSAGFDPRYASAFEKKNAAFLGCGVCFNKYTGSRGKSSSSDANAEYIAYLRNILDSAEVQYQFAELGRVDLGGGGTIAFCAAKYCMNVIDAGVAVLSMHAPYEVINKADLYEAYKAYCTFLKN